MIRSTLLLLFCISAICRFPPVYAIKEQNEAVIEGGIENEAVIERGIEGGIDEEIDPLDEDDLKEFLLEISVVPTPEEIIEIANDTEKFDETYERKLKRAYEMASMGLHNPPPVTVTIIKTTLTDEETKSATILFYVRSPTKGNLKGSDVQKTFKILSRPHLWDAIGGKVETLDYPVAVTTDTTIVEKPQSRTFSIVAFVMGWMCLAALIVILAYLGIKYRDGIKSLAKRIEHWSNPNRSGYANLGGEVHSHSATDWRNDSDAILRDDPSPTGEDSKPKKKLRAPGGLLTDLEEGAEKPSPAHQSYGTADAANVGNSTQIRLSDLAGPEQHQQGDGTGTPPMSPTSMQRHLIKKYQDKQVEDHRAKAEDTLAATGSEVFPDDFADCVEDGEEEIFQLKP